MIIFDYGNTLLYEPDWNSDRGDLELCKYITKNPNNCTIDDIRQEIEIVFNEIGKVRSVMHYDIPCTTGNRLAYEHLGIEFSLTALEREIIFWTAACPGAVVPNADQVWYCGDSIKADVYGSKSAGMFPVLFEGDIPIEQSMDHTNEGLSIDFEYLHIQDWCELIDVLENL